MVPWSRGCLSVGRCLGERPSASRREELARWARLLQSSIGGRSKAKRRGRRRARKPVAVCITRTGGQKGAGKRRRKDFRERKTSRSARRQRLKRLAAFSLPIPNSERHQHPQDRKNESTGPSSWCLNKRWNARYSIFLREVKEEPHTTPEIRAGIDELPVNPRKKENRRRPAKRLP